MCLRKQEKYIVFGNIQYSRNIRAEIVSVIKDDLDLYWKNII